MYVQIWLSAQTLLKWVSGPAADYRRRHQGTGHVDLRICCRHQQHFALDHINISVCDG